MVSKASTAQSAKRKKTEEMADSPPKRVTRARTAKVVDDVEPAAKATKATKASAKTTAEKKKQTPALAGVAQKRTTAPAKATKRKTRADDDVEAPVKESVAELAPEPAFEDEPQPKPATARVGRKKALAAAEKVEADAPKPRGRQTKAAAAEKPKVATTSARGRPKRTQAAEPPQEPEAAEQEETVEPVKKTTRGRAAPSKVTKAKASTRAATTKKVQFQDDIQDNNDKENIPVEVEAPKKSAMKPTGIRAKPARKPAAARTTTRGRKTAKTEDSLEQEQLPLSPKKVNQVAKAGSTTSEDELAGEKTPIRSPSKPFMKFQASPVRAMNVAIQHNQSTAPSSPSKSSPAHMLASPARRPPPSPFKDGLKLSPKKIDINFGVEKPLILSSLNKTPAKSSLLQESPRKGKLQNSVARPTLLPSQTPMKASLLQSPARRPTTSPFKSQTKAKTSNSSKKATPVKLPSPPRPLRFSPQQCVSSPLRAAKSPERMLPVHNITPKGQEAKSTRETPADRLPESPSMLVSNQTVTAGTEVNIDADTTMQDAEIVEPECSTKTPEVPPSSAFTIANEAMRRVSMESGSTDELASPDKTYAPTPLRKNGISARDFGTPSTAARVATMEGLSENGVSFTPLVGKLTGWAASSPGNQEQSKPSRQARGMFSLGGPVGLNTSEQDMPVSVAALSAKTSFSEDGLVVTNDELNDSTIDMGFEIVADDEAARIAMQSSMESHTSEEYGDENAAPTEAEMLREEQDADRTLTCTPEKVFMTAKVTPAKAITRRPQEVHTVSKVPLRASAEETPLKVTRQRSRSLVGPLTVVHEPLATTQEAAATPLPSQPATPNIAATIIPQTPSSGMKLDAETPGRTVRKGVVPDVLKGAVVYVDVHTTEGADASGIFIDLLTQMGARCVKQWSWNPRASMAGSLENSTSPSAESPSSSPSTKVGITHVVYKDGGKRTLEKVRCSNGVVLCVGVGWVLDCEREDKWLDEADYAIDTSIVPRGGGRRRKSMEPRALANMGGNLVPAGSEMTPAKTNVSPTEEFLTFNTPVSRRDAFVIQPLLAETQITEEQAPAVAEAPSTPVFTLGDGEDAMSPTTPYYLSLGAELVQRTCPPKQMGQAGMLFPDDGNIEDQPDEQVRQRLVEARRKSLQWVSKTRSPLGRTVSYGK